MNCRKPDYKKSISVALLLTMMSVFILLPASVHAEAPYRGYNYNVWGESVPAPSCYLPEEVIRAEALGTKAFKSPQDMCVDRDGNIYVLDTGNNRIVILGPDLSLKKVIDKFVKSDGEEVLKEPKGIFITSGGEIYIADTGNARIVVTDTDGNVIKVYPRPKSAVFDKELQYQPEKVAVDGKGYIYVVAAGIFKGLVQMDQDGYFLSYFGSNRVEATFSLLSDMFWKKIFSQKQKDAMVRYVPIEYSGIDVDKEDFIYGIARKSLNSIGEIKKLNPLGESILKSPPIVKPGVRLYSGDYGDLETMYTVMWQQIDTTFVDISVDEDGMINALDLTRGRVFQYDSEGYLLGIFGGIGEQEGLFKAPVAVESLNEKVLVLDSSKNSITVFCVTSFGKCIREAVQLFNKGFYDDAAVKWKEVIKRNSNYELAYTGIAKALYREHKYQEAMVYYENGKELSGFDEAFNKYRKQFLRDYFIFFFLGAVGVVIFIWRVLRRRRKHR